MRWWWPVGLSPALLGPQHVDILDGAFGLRSVAEVFDYPLSSS